MAQREEKIVSSVARLPVYHPEEHALIAAAREASREIAEKYGRADSSTGSAKGNGFGYVERFGGEV